jgi:hypothetical protein
MTDDAPLLSRSPKWGFICITAPPNRACNRQRRGVRSASSLSGDGVAGGDGRYPAYDCSRPRSGVVFLRPAVFRPATGCSPTAKSSSFAPALSFSRSHTGCAPLPAHVLPESSRYLTATFRPFIELPRPFLLENHVVKLGKLVCQFLSLAAERTSDVLAQLQKGFNGHRGKVAFSGH